MCAALSKSVVVVESPAKAKTIEGYLGVGYTVLASYGHIRDLPSKDGAVDPDNDFAMHYVVQKDSEKNVKAILAALKDADTLYLATDLDREGEAISWHVWQEVKARAPKLAARLDVKRIEFSEITRSAITEAIRHPRELALNLINAQQARRALDYLVGFNLSPVLWRKVKPGLSAGRVQSVALRLIAERETEIEAFVPQEYWTLAGTFTTLQGKALPANLVTFAGKKVEKFSFPDEGSAREAKAAVAPPQYRVEAVETSPKNRYPSPPFITSTLQQEASRKLGFSARRTMQTAQRLYEAGHITYMRTDSVNLASEAIGKLRAAVEKIYGADQLPSKPNYYANKSKNAQEAHEAIRPTDPFTRTAGAEEDQRRLYQLIWQRTVACQMAPARLEQTTISLLSQQGNHGFRATGSVVVFPGFLSVYQEGQDDTSDDAEGKILPKVTQGDVLAPPAVQADQHFTEPPPRYSEATLVKALEEYGIGRPSTYASIIGVLQDRDYVTLDKKRFYPTDTGRVVNRFLTTHFGTYVDYHFTADMEEDLDAIARGEHDWKPTLRAFWKPFKAQVDTISETVKKSDMAEKTGEACPTCGTGELVWRLSKFGKKFKGCNRYPECTYIESTRPAAEADPAANTGIACPACAKGTLVKKLSRYGKTFYSCNTWPTCNYACWDMPVATPCPTCSWPILTQKSSKKYGEYLVCPQPTCSYTTNEQASAAAAVFRERFAKSRAAAAEKKEAAKAAQKAKKAEERATAKAEKSAGKPTAKKAPAKKPTSKKAAALGVTRVVRKAPPKKK